ncbi:MAG: hypothetical protein ACM3P0_18020 [Acidobacteriota bacterium]
MIWLLAYFVLFVLWTVIELTMAPKGYEDKNGFHFGEPPYKGSKNQKIKGAK